MRWSIPIALKDGDTCYCDENSIKIIHADGSKTIYYKSIFHRIWQNLKSTAQKFKSVRRKLRSGKTSKILKIEK